MKSIFIVLGSAVAFGFAACAGPSADISAPEPKPEATSLSTDIQTICEQVEQVYYYFESRAQDWPAACASAEAAALNLTEGESALAILETLIDNLYDPHIALNANNQSSPRLWPSGADIWVDQQAERFVVTAVRHRSGAANAGLHVGAELIAFNDLEPDALAQTRIHSRTGELSPDRQLWALNAAIAGRRDQPRVITVIQDGETIQLELGNPEPEQSSAPVSAMLLPDRIGFIRFNNSLRNSETVAAFNEALDSFESTEGLIIDLRNTPGGGNTGVAEPIMGRFVDTATAYQKTVLPDGTEIDREIQPTGPWTYTQPVVVLSGRWTGSMGEGMTIGFDGMQRATVLSSQMAGLAGGTDPIALDHTGLSLWLPVYDLRHLDGTPRHNWRPEALSVSDNGNGPDLVLEQAQALLAN